MAAIQTATDRAIMHCNWYVDVCREAFAADVLTEGVWVESAWGFFRLGLPYKVDVYSTLELLHVEAEC